VNFGLLEVNDFAATECEVIFIHLHTSRRRHTHPRCRTSPTTRNEKTTDKTTKYVTTTKPAGKLYPTIPCKNPESDTG